MRAERDTLFADFAQITQTEDLKAAGVGQNRAWPRHEAMQSAQLPDLLDSRPQVEVIGVSQENFNAEFFENVLRDAFDRGQGSHRHEDRGFDFAVRRDQATGTGWPGSSLNLKLDGHCRNCSGLGSPVSFAHHRNGERPGLRGLERKNPGLNFAFVDRQPSHTHRQVETSWPRTSRIEVEHAVLQFLFGHVAVAVNDRGESRCFRLQIEFLETVEHVDRHLAELEDVRGGNFLRPLAVINVPAHGRYRCDHS